MQKYKMLSVCILFQNVEDKVIPGEQNIKQERTLVSSQMSVNQPSTVGFQPREAVGLSKNVFRGQVMWI